MTTTDARPRTGRRGLGRYDRLEVYLDHGSQPNALHYRWRYRSGANGEEIGRAHKSWGQRDRCLANARTVTGFDLDRDPKFTEPQPGIDGDVHVWLVDPKARRGYPG